MFPYPHLHARMSTLTLQKPHIYIYTSPPHPQLYTPSSAPPPQHLHFDNSIPTHHPVAHSILCTPTSTPLLRPLHTYTSLPHQHFHAFIHAHPYFTSTPTHIHLQLHINTHTYLSPRSYPKPFASPHQNIIKNTSTPIQCDLHLTSTINKHEDTCVTTPKYSHSQHDLTYRRFNIICRPLIRSPIYC